MRAVRSPAFSGRNWCGKRAKIASSSGPRCSPAKSSRISWSGVLLTRATNSADDMLSSSSGCSAMRAPVTGPGPDGPDGPPNLLVGNHGGKRSGASPPTRPPSRSAGPGGRDRLGHRLAGERPAARAARRPPSPRRAGASRRPPAAPRAGTSGRAGRDAPPAAAAAAAVRSTRIRTPTPLQATRAPISAFSSVDPACTRGTPWCRAVVTPVYPPLVTHTWTCGSSRSYGMNSLTRALAGSGATEQRLELRAGHAAGGHHHEHVVVGQGAQGGHHQLAHVRPDAALRHVHHRPGRGAHLVPPARRHPLRRGVGPQGAHPVHGRRQVRHGVLEGRGARLQVEHRRDRRLQHVEPVGRQAQLGPQPVVALLRLREDPPPRGLAHRVVAQPRERAAHRQQPRPERGGLAVRPRQRVRHRRSPPGCRATGPAARRRSSARR